MEALTAYYDTIFPYMPGYLQATLLVLQMTIVITLLSWAIGIVTALGNLLKNKMLIFPLWSWARW